MANPFYFLSGTPEEFQVQLNIILASISDRLDAIEGLRGNSIINNDLTLWGQLLVKDVDGNEIQGFKDE